MIMLKKLLPLFAAALCLLTACGKNENTFIVGFDANFPPYGFKDANGEYTGFDLELAEEVARRNGWTLIKKPINWDAKDSELASGNIDCIWNGFTINGREEKYEWTKPYINNSQVLVVKSESGIKNLADLAGKIVAVQTDTPIQKALQPGGSLAHLGASFAELRTVANYDQAVMELEAGGCDAVAIDIGVALYKMKGDKFRILNERLMSEQYGIGFLKGNTKMRDIVEKTLIEMVQDGTAAKISAKYFNGEDVLIIGK